MSSDTVYLTIFSAPKPFTNRHIATIQHNAIHSWRQLGKDVRVLLVGEEEGLAKAAAAHGVPLLTSVRRSAYGTPLVSSIFELARQAGESQYMAYVNADILLMDDLVEALQAVSHAPECRDKPFLMIGQRWDLDVAAPLDFSSDWQQRLRADISQRGRLHPPAGSDYFVFPNQAYTDMPDFAIGRAGWDNWAIYHARHSGWPTIDATPAVMIVHQNHDYSHLPGGVAHYNHPESQANIALAGGLAHMYMLLDTTHQLVGRRLQAPPLTLPRALRAMERRLTPPDGCLRGGRGSVARLFRRLRRRITGGVGE